MLALYLIIMVTVQWSVGRKLRQAATQPETSTIIAIIVKISPIIACALAIHVVSELDFSIQIGLGPGTQHAMSDTRQTSPSARGEHMIAPTRTE